jgi:hypothetical protein
MNIKDLSETALNLSVNKRIKKEEKKGGKNRERKEGNKIILIFYSSSYFRLPASP